MKILPVFQSANCDNIPVLITGTSKSTKTNHQKIQKFTVPGTCTPPSVHSKPVRQYRYVLYEKMYFYLGKLVGKSFTQKVNEDS